MAKLQQIDSSNQSNQLIDQEILKEITQELVLSQEGPINKDSARGLFDKHNLSLDIVAKQMRNLLATGEETTRLKILQDLLKIHGAMEEAVESKSISINFSFTNTDDQAGKIKVLIPR